jgi:hypothetical protein
LYTRYGSMQCEYFNNEAMYYLDNNTCTCMRNELYISLYNNTFCLVWFFVFCVVFCISFFVIFLLAIVLSVCLSVCLFLCLSVFTDSDNPFGIFKLFYIVNYSIVDITYTVFSLRTRKIMRIWTSYDEMKFFYFTRETNFSIQRMARRTHVTLWRLRTFLYNRFRLIALNAAFNNISVISWRSVLLVEETRIPGENHYSRYRLHGVQSPNKEDNANMNFIWWN